MGTICGNERCKFINKTTHMCIRDFTILNQFGQCTEWFNKQGIPLQMHRENIVETVKQQEAQANG